AEYYERLQAVRDRGDWEGWLKFFLEGVYHVSNEAITVARRILTLQKEHRDLVVNNLGKGAANALVLLESLYTLPYVTIQGAAERTGLSFSPANNLVTRLTHLGILQEATGKKRNRLFKYTSYVSLFEDQPEEVSPRGE
ncbi:MAG: Fic family protein, partial [Isosphaeraceae bacterium]